MGNRRMEQSIERECVALPVVNPYLSITFATKVKQEEWV